MVEQMCFSNIELSHEKSFLPRKYFPVLTTCQIKAKLRKLDPTMAVSTLVFPNKAFSSPFACFYILILNGQNTSFPP